jgi:phage gp36-like protein
MFLSIEDYKAVCGDDALNVIQQSDDANRERSERYAIEEISSYLRSRYDIAAAFAAAGDARNQQLVMLTCDIALYHLASWLAKRNGFEIRQLRYERAIKWLETVQKGNASPDLPLLIDEAGNDIGNPVKWGSWGKNDYEY